MRSPTKSPNDDGLSNLSTTIEISSPWTDIALEEKATTPCLPPPVFKPRQKSLPFKTRFRFSRSNKITWLVFLGTVGLLYLNWGVWNDGTRRTEASDLVLKIPSFEGLQFINASHPHLRFVGRWMSVANGTRQEGSFSGIYFDFEITGSTTVFLSLQNTNRYQELPKLQKPPRTLDFLPAITPSVAGPISLLARVDEDEYTIFPNATSVVKLRNGELDPLARHYIRVIAPNIKENRTTLLQVNGIYIDGQGELLAPLDATTLPEKALGKDKATTAQTRRKMLEIVTDLPGTTTEILGYKEATPGHEVLRGVMGWDYLLGEMFEADHVSVGADGMCLIQNCIGGRGSPLGISDLFFQSGPLGSEQYNQAWNFDSYIPDAMVMNIGNSDWESFQTYSQEYNMSIWDLSVAFENSYISLIRKIRKFAYPPYSPTILTADAFPQTSDGVPIFVMRPLRGQLEGATHSVVERLRRDGDKSVFWLDTSGWLDTELELEGSVENQDFFLDEETKGWRLTQRGNQRVAILLHLHVCRFLAQEAEKCAFLPPEIYQGKAADPEMVRFEEYIDGERERKLKGLFWEE
ncbi:hypothetical protein HYFRA_00008309 [Hymenoscyphus fraxineus]|uniref:Uncharacterized protein n=1 Tax=Hymenoscyphus fraxineus TaxID=746836 RepID=A0A9N9KPW7_9HELO|nr:hypothetical protein HYFRA_00014210 [Hymenoscyphus fraxineus]CAG8949452.1 hypothetical protein HYFRA_00014225 [Hymenoscyphus fraxineus]CAG8950076.1 hypothetical protein HYFRA_00008309 [Hymenoscyphus fraxineus]